MPQKVSKNPSLDEVFSRRQMSVRSNDNGEFLSKMTFSEPKSWNDKERSARFVMTAEVVDRYGDIVVAKGADLTNFNDNPVALFAHNSRAFPIGMWGEIKTVNANPKRIEGTMKIANEGTLDEADTAAKLIAAGILRACSIGFMPKAWESIKDDKDYWMGWKFVEWELMECSACAVPANPKAIVKSAGGNEGLALQAIELVLDEWAMNPDGLIVPRSEYEKAYDITRRKGAPTMVEVRAIEQAPEINIDPIARDVNENLESILSRVTKSFAETIGTMFGKSLPVVEPVVEETTEETPELTELSTLTREELAAHVLKFDGKDALPFIIKEGTVFLNLIPDAPALDVDPEFEKTVANNLAKDLDFADEDEVNAALLEGAKLLADIED